MLYDGGTAVPLDSLPVPPEVASRATAWVHQYDESKLPWEDGDSEWLAEGRALFVILRETLAGHEIDIFDDEGLWDASTDEYRQIRARWPAILRDRPGR